MKQPTNTGRGGGPWAWLGRRVRGGSSKLVTGTAWLTGRLVAGTVDSGLKTRGGPASGKWMIRVVRGGRRKGEVPGT